MENKIIGIDSILEKTIVIDDIKIKEMSVLQFLKLLRGDYDFEEVNNITDLVFECTGIKIDIYENDENVEKLTLYFNAILQMNNAEKTGKVDNDYNYRIDYSYFIARIMKSYNYKLEEVYRLPYSVFNTLLNHVTALEANADLRMSRVVDNGYSKNQDTQKNYTSTINRLSEIVKGVIDCTMTDEAEINKWKRRFGTKDIEKAVKGGEK